jgi:hypothetical protein
MFEKLKVEDPIKNAVLVLIDEEILNISYEETVDFEIYKVTNSIIFLDYIEEILNKVAAKSFKSKITIINIFNSFQNYLRILLKLNEFDYNRQSTIDEFKKSMKSLSSVNNVDFEPKLGLGQCDLPLSFRLINVLPSRLIGQETMTINSILLQQFLRFSSLKHGSTLISTINVDSIKQQPLEFLETLDLSTPKPIFDSTQTQEFPLIIPNGWDSFNKIILLGNSSIYRHDLLLTSERDCNELNNVYNNTFYNSIDISELFKRIIPNYDKLENCDKTSNLMTFNDMLQKVQEAEIHTDPDITI